MCWGSGTAPPCCACSLVPFLVFLCFLDGDHTPGLSDDKHGFGHSCRRAGLRRRLNKDACKSPSLFFLTLFMPSVHLRSRSFRVSLQPAVSGSTHPAVSPSSLHPTPTHPTPPLPTTPAALRRLAQSPLCVRKQTQIIPAALLACDQGLARRF